MSIEILLEGQLEKESDREAFSDFLHSLCEDKKLKMEDYDTHVIIDVCPEGFIECSYEGVFISVAAQTNVAGPGFHAFVAAFYDDVLTQGGIGFDVTDLTNYYVERDFENLKYRYFYQWLQEMANYVLDHHDEEADLCVAWPSHYYHPSLKPEYVITPMGYMAINDFQDLEMEELAARFFVWNELDRDACYYRNCALALLWKECHFEYSAMNEYTDKIANIIMDYIEAAYDQDATLPLPKDAYEMLAQVMEREILILECHNMELPLIGYRRDIVSYTLGNWNIPADGCAEKTFDETTQTLHFMAPYEHQDTPWQWMIKANAYVFEKEVPSFLESLEYPSKDVVDSFAFTKDHITGKAIVEDMQEYYMMIVQINSDTETLFLEYIIKNKEDITVMKKWCEDITHRVHVKDEIQS